ncbi:hypothetical protein BZG02_07905 [Labilibaculum filiforme]|uniref:Thioredoxin domain-containing protein n=2 Tax=Labilibaculum filiforme TaxID=1940526 RepID=A0A2N3I0S4_9BACT|nr:hypothetical protein BZG02_07905 [Labilibaculum filiforme]
MNHLLVLISMFAVLACGNDNTYVNPVIEGTVTGFDKEISFFGINYGKQVKVDSAGNFRITGDSIGTGMYTLGFTMLDSKKVYLKSGTVLKITIDYPQLIAKNKEAVTISGENIEETELLHELDMNSPIYEYESMADYKKYHYEKVYAKQPDVFLAEQKSKLKETNVLIDRFVENHSTIDMDFIEILKLEKLLSTNFTIGHYHKMIALYMPNEEIDVPANFTNHFAAQIPQDDFEMFKKSTQYKSYLTNKYAAKMYEALSSYERESLDFYKAQVDFLEKCTFPKVIVEDFTNGLRVGYVRSKDEKVKTYLDSMIQIKITDVKTLKIHADFKANEASYKDGDLSPQFTLVDIDGIEVSIADFKGSMVMMDCWATWCAPCIEGLPKFNKLKEKYKGKNIVFLTVSIDDNVKAWKKKVQKNSDDILGGIQLNTSQNENTFKKDFRVQGIPHYILIGADGRIIKRSAPHPGSEELYELINTNLK